MAREITSKHLIGATELTVIMPIKQGFVDVRGTVTYATRLRLMLRILTGIRKASRESVIAREYVGPIERLQTIDEARFGVIDNGKKLLLCVSFDKPWEPYIRTIRDDAGPLLDAICSHCDQYTEHYRCGLGYAKFAEWVRKNQVDMDFFYSAQPALTTDDYRYLKKLELRQRTMRNITAFDRSVSELNVGSPIEEANAAVAMSLYAPKMKVGGSVANRKQRLIRQGLRAVKAMYALDALYPQQPKAGNEEREKLFWIKAAQSILAQFDSETLVPSGTPLYKQYQDELLWFQTEVPTESQPVQEREPGARDCIQGNILKSYKGMAHGVLVFVSFASAEAGKAFLKKYRGKITADEGSDEVTKAFNLGFTRHGLKTLGLPKKIYRHFPKEYREGMEARAGMLGDVRENHPLHWKLPTWNWPVGIVKDDDDNSIEKVRLATIDVVITILEGVEGENPDDDEYKFDNNTNYLTISKNHPLYKDIEQVEETAGVHVLSVQPMRRKYMDEKAVVDDEKPDARRKRYVEDHFGFADGISQPKPRTVPKHRDDVSYGELIVGYFNDKGTDSPDTKRFADTLMNDGSFLVIRKLRQSVDEFNKMIDLQSDKNNIGKDELKGKLMGRTPDGRLAFPVTHIQKFDFQADLKGHGCPFQAHIRRTNPRPKADPTATPDPFAKVRKQVPRIMRRGFSYGSRFADEPSDDVDRGLIFMSYSANIAEQFEVIQRWISGGNSTGVLSVHDDPLLGVPPPSDVKRTFRFHHNTKSARCDLGSKHFVELQWGLYLFTPSLPTIDRFVQGFDEPIDVSEGVDVIENLQKLRKIVSSKTIREAWKTVLEDRSAKAGGVTAAVWTAIREKCDGVLQTPYGLLIGSYDEVKKIFDAPDPYSVREYWFRMKASIGDGFLGMDPAPVKIERTARKKVLEKDDKYHKYVKTGTYESQATFVNAEIFKISEEESYQVAKKLMLVAIDDERNHKILDLRKVGGLVMMKLCQYYFGMPRRPDPDMIRNFIFSARYIFSSPGPTSFLEEQAKIRGDASLNDIHDFVKRQRKNPDIKDIGVISGVLFDRTEQFPDNDDGNEYLAKTIAGLSNGLIAPTLGSFLSMMSQLISSERLWRVQQQLLLNTDKRDNYADIEEVIVPIIIDELYTNPVPAIVHRTTTAPVPFKPWKFKDGELKNASPKEKNLALGSRVIVGIDSATQDTPIPHKFEDVDVIFGGKFDPAGSTGTHACPGARMGIGILAGMLTALLESGNLKLENAPLTLSRNMEDEHAIP